MKNYTIGSKKSAEELRQLVEEGEAHFEQEFRKLAADLAKDEDLHLIGLTGPTCSGKTTAAEKLTDALEIYGKRLHVISVDDFYFNKAYLQALAEKKGRKEPDYDSEETIDVDLLRECTHSLLCGRETRMPHFNFSSGVRECGELLSPQPNDLFLFEGIQILYPKVDRILSGRSYRSIYISPASAIEVGGELFLPNEIRLMRRLVRDYHFRNTAPDFTFYLWQSVRENEEKNIFPYVSRCNDRVDSTMPYEIGMIKPYLERILPQVPDISPFAEDARRILARVREVQPVSDAYLPENSLYREFI